METQSSSVREEGEDEKGDGAAKKNCHSVEVESRLGYQMHRRLTVSGVVCAAR